MQCWIPKRKEKKLFRTAATSKFKLKHVRQRHRQGDRDGSPTSLKVQNIPVSVLVDKHSNTSELNGG